MKLKPLDNPRGWRYIGDAVTCPVCGRRSFYSRGEDRFVHSDGSANRHCWVALSRGDEHQAAGEPGWAA